MVRDTPGGKPIHPIGCTDCRQGDQDLPPDLGPVSYHVMHRNAEKHLRETRACQRHGGHASDHADNHHLLNLESCTDI